MKHLRVLPFRILSFSALLFVAWACVPGAQAQEAATTTPTIESALANLKMRAIGPAIMGGRIDDIAADPTNPEVIYIGAAAGGAWKTTDGGMTWTPIFENEPNPSIGAIAVAPSNPSIVWVGTGEANNRQSASWGDGVYKSTDGGKTYMNVGLRTSKHINRIVIDPRNTDVVLVAATGSLWGPGGERGVFKTVDGGKTWKQVLKV